MVGETEIRKAFSLSLNGTTVEPGCIYGGPDEAPHLDLVQEEPGKEIFWIKNGGVYVAARNIVSGVSWTDLYVNGWVLGRELELDGRAYLCRLMEVGETADRYCEYERLLAFVALDHARTNSLSWGREQTGERWLPPGADPAVRTGVRCHTTTEAALAAGGPFWNQSC